MAFKKAERKKAKLRLALCGPSGSGKTYSALRLAAGIGGDIALIDTENGSGSLYSSLCEYDVDEITPPFTVDKYIAKIKEAESAGYNVLIIDSLSHAWAGQGGLLEEVDKRNKGNSFAAWRDVTPMHNKLIDTILQSKLHIIVTMRSKTAYEIEKDEKGKAVPVKKGMAPIQRDGLEYEFTVVLDLDNKKHVAEAGKDRTGLFDGKIDVPTEETGRMLKTWLESGIDVPAPTQQPMSFSEAQQQIAKEKAQEKAQEREQANLITELQLKKLFAMSKENGLTSDDMKNLLHWKYNVQSSKELTKQQASEAIEKLSDLWAEFVADQSQAG